MAAFTDIVTFQFQAHTPQGQAVRNTLHFRRNPTAGQVDATWLAALLADANTTSFANAYKALIPTTGGLDGILARATKDPLFPADERDSAYRSFAAAGTRSVSAPASPDELTTVTKLSGDLAGRAYRGRMWMPPPCERDSVSGEVINGGSSYWTNMALFITEISKTTYPSGAGHYGGAWNDCDLCVFSRSKRLASGRYYARVPFVQPVTKLHWLRSRNPSNA